MDEDNNVKQQTDLFMLQQKAQDYQDKLNKLQNKEYQGKYQGVSIRQKGDGTILEVHIDQSFYETASKGQIEIAFFKLLNNLHTAVLNDQKSLQEELQMDIAAFQKDHPMDNNGNN
jgi:DNA-binding protein YbaB